MTSYKVAFIKTDAFQKKVAGKNYYEGYDNQVEGSAPIFNFYFTEDYTRSWDSGNPFSYSSLRNGEIESIDYDSSKLTVKFLNYDTFSYDEKVYEVGVPTTDEKIVDPSDHSKLFEFTPTEIFVGDSLNSDDPITEKMRDSVMEFEQNKGKIPKMAETFEARTTRKSRKWDDETGKGNIEMKPDGKQSGLRGYDRSPKGTSDSKLDWDSANDANTKIKANLRGKEDLRDFKKHGMAEYVACAECGDDVYELESNTCCEECNDNLNEAFEWIAKENGEENLRDFMDSIDITDDDLNAENVKIDWDAVAKEEWELGYPHDDDLLSYQNKQANKSLLSCLNSYLKVAKDVATMGHYDYPDLTEYTITPAYEKAYGRRPTSAEIDEALPKVIKGLRKQAKTGKLAGVDDWEELSKALKSPLSQYTWGQGYEGSYGNKGRKGWFTNDDNYEPLNAETFGADENRFMIACGRCGWNFTDEYIKDNTDGNIRPMYGDHCSCGGMIKRYDFEPEPKPKGFFAKLFGKNAETFEANAKSGDKVYIITRRCEDYSAYRELDVAVFGSKTEAKKKFNYLFKEEKEQNYPDETIADAKSYMRWGEVGWGIESFMADDMIYELREQTIGKNAMSGFYFDAEGDSQ